MLSLFDIEKQIKKGDIKNCYAFCGADENLIKENVNLIINNAISKDFIDLNFSRFDGAKVDADSIINACETLPFMCDKKVVLIYRADFLEDSNKKGTGDRDRVCKEIEKYIENIPSHCVLIMYYVFKSDRDKPSKIIKKLDKKCCVVKVDKLKGQILQKKVKAMFEDRGKKINKAELSLFCSEIDNNLNIVTNEVEKLISYADGREITKQDIYAMMPQKSESDIFNLVDFLSQKKVKKALDIFNELIYRGEKISHILFMIERQFNILFNIKRGIMKGKSKDELSSELKLHPYICEKMIIQSKKYDLKHIEKNLDLCLETEKRIKSLSTDGRVEMEVFMINTLMN